MNCPLCTKPVGKQGDCEDCGIFWCRYCERWRGWKKCCADNMPHACDDCWMPIEEQFKKDDLVWWTDPDEDKGTGLFKVVKVYSHHVALVNEEGSEVEALPEELIPVKSAIQKDKLLTAQALKNVKYDIHVDRTGLAPGHELILECGPPSPIPLPKNPTFPFRQEEADACRRAHQGAAEGGPEEPGGDGEGR